MQGSQRRTTSVLVAVAAALLAVTGMRRRRRLVVGDMSDAVTTYADGVEASYGASLESATALRRRVDAFVADPTEETLEAAKQAWLTARDDYGLTEAFRFYGGPIDDEETRARGPHQRLAARRGLHRLRRGRRDGTGIDQRPRRRTRRSTPQLITSLNEQGGETNISTGWHAIEFLLWGQDLTGTGRAPGP